MFVYILYVCMYVFLCLSFCLTCKIVRVYVCVVFGRESLIETQESKLARGQTHQETQDLGVRSRGRWDQ